MAPAGVPHRAAARPAQPLTPRPPPMPDDQETMPPDPVRARARPGPAGRRPVADRAGPYAAARDLFDLAAGEGNFWQAVPDAADPSRERLYRLAMAGTGGASFDQHVTATGEWYAARCRPTPAGGRWWGMASAAACSSR